MDPTALSQIIRGIGLWLAYLRSCITCQESDAPASNESVCTGDVQCSVQKFDSRRSTWAVMIVDHYYNNISMLFSHRGRSQQHANAVSYVRLNVLVTNY
ncbi:unnamed protein product [Prunus armeniaca]|uniref:Uncharacterized protein n=1 Tax=Prunus armeniaca TaxID=36596 RepID=A0A6J5XFQ8_PRUAR|nr:unnamed protein product [Prunus armeniaca]